MLDGAMRQDPLDQAVEISLRFLVVIKAGSLHRLLKKRCWTSRDRGHRARARRAVALPI